MTGLIVGLAAGLLFLSEPAAGKTILPWLGGTPAAWGTTLIFFQVVLIAGYWVVDASLRRGGPRRLGLTHALILTAAGLALAAGVPFQAVEPPAEPTFVATFTLLSLELGPPILALALTAPALQARLAALRGDRGAAGYALYAASNTGSLLGLLAYPWLIEPWLPLGLQWSSWRIGFWVFALLVVGLWTVSWKRLEPGPRESTSSDPIPWQTRAHWLVRAAIPAALLAAVTAYCTRDLAPIPLLWVIPLALYLLTWIIAFSGRFARLVDALTQLQDPVAVVATLMFLIQPGVLIGAIIALGCMVVVGIVQHSALARSSPPERLLGRFYVWLAIGGALGTFAVVVLAPMLSPVPIEAPLALALAVALGRPAVRHWSRTGRVGFHTVVVAGATVPWWFPEARSRTLVSLVILAAGLAMLWRSSPRRQGLVLAGLAAAALAIQLGSREHIGSTHGLLGRFTVERHAGGTDLVSGSTIHGFERGDEIPGVRPRATLYYARSGPFGDVVNLLETRLPAWEFGVVGLGVGSLGCTAQPGARLTYFEINPGIIRLARDTTMFRSLEVCSPGANVRLGDARLNLEKGTGSFDLLGLDAFNSDAIPTHLLTREAVSLYRNRLSPGGVIAFHVSNRFLDLVPVVAGLAHDAGWTAVKSRDRAPAWTEEDRRDRAIWATVVAIAADSATLASLIDTGRWEWAEPTPGPVWTDNYTPVARTLRLSRSNLFGK